MDFLKPDSPVRSSDAVEPGWKLMIVDDDPEIHQVTRMVLADFNFDGQRLRFLNAHSAAECRNLLPQHRDTAVILLDVVMEEETAGLELVRWIRDELENPLVRIILRTGQPGYAPETRVIREYDINDYKEKTELTSQKLFTAVTAAIRSYRDLRVIEQNRRGLENIIAASATIFEPTSLKVFAEGILTQLTALLKYDDSSLLVQASGLAVSPEGKSFTILAGTGDYAADSPTGPIPDDEERLLRRALAGKSSFFDDEFYVGYYRARSGRENLLLLRGNRPLKNIDKNLISIFSANIAVAFDNLDLNLEIEETQKEVIYTLGEIVESRHQETGRHVLRVGKVAEILAQGFGLDEEKTRLIRYAAPMHDVGKIGIPDSILHKPGPLTAEELDLMRSHTEIGYRLLKQNKRTILQAAAAIALYHHEHWNGGGYPKGLKGEEIPPEAQIVGLADVFDALTHPRVYKEAWPLDRVLAYIEDNRERQFSAPLVDVFLRELPAIEEVLKQYPD